jgi:hypothetical protein
MVVSTQLNFLKRSGNQQIVRAKEPNASKNDFFLISVSILCKNPTYVMFHKDPRKG